MNEDKNIEPGEQAANKSLAGENISSAEPVTTAEQSLNDLNILNDSNDPMEVHHHTHAGHHKKTWKDYFWEFLMLFLAVFCGFLAEYQLEHVIEHQREKEFIKSMVEDLQDDHEKLIQYTADLKLGLLRMDSMITILDDNKLIKEKGNQMYYFGRMSPRVNVFVNNTRTLEQLKNSGSFRLIRNTSVSNKIMAYYSSIGFIRHLEGLYFQEFDEYKRIASKIFDPAIFRMMELPDGNISREANNPALRTTDPELLKELGVFAVYMNGSRRSIIPAAETLQKNGDELIAYLKKEYHLD